MPENRPVTLTAPSEDQTLEEQLSNLVRYGRISLSEKTKLLMAHHGEIQTTCAEAVANAVQSKNGDLSEKDKEIVKLSLLLEAKTQGPIVDKGTKLLDGAYFEELLPKLVDSFLSERLYRDRRSGCPCLMIGDVRGLKIYNDTFGHDVGDALMAAVGDTIHQNLRTGELARLQDWAARSNRKGDEIEIFMLGARDPIDAGNAASRIKDAFFFRKDWEEFHTKLNLIRPTVDFGAAAIKGSSLRGVLEGLSTKDREEKVTDIIQKWRKKADVLMYDAKKERADSISFAWFDYIDGEFVDITDQMSTLKRLHGLKKT
jgi:diguanylate cyclase (GGDEF)-like protein